jgi:CheY-like chemotaxis protein
VLSLEVSDNGKGLTEVDLAKARSFGIRGLHERASTVGGWVDLSSSRAGTTLILSIPLDEVAAAQQGRHRFRSSGRRRARPIHLGRTMTRVIICDDHALIRRGIRDTLADATDIEVVGEAGDYGELRTLMRQHSCDVLVLDINMPGRSGLDVLHVLKDEGNPVKVLVVSMYPEDQYALRALKAGAHGYVNKGATRRCWCRRCAPCPRAASTSPPRSPSCWPRTSARTRRPRRRTRSSPTASCRPW